MRRDLSAAAFRRHIEELDDRDALATLYCYQIGSTFVHMNLMEDALIRAMSICDRVKVARAFGNDEPAWQRLLDKTQTLQNSTLGSLITLLSRHNIAETDLAYLRWLKGKRDLFVHRLFHDSSWPGELDRDELPFRCRRLLYLEIIFARASRRVWHIFARANLMEMTDLGSDGFLMMNLDVFD
jgi:hypothetical protein